MQFILPFCHKDAWLAEKLCAWIGELGGLDSKHRCLLLAAKATPPKLRIAVWDRAKQFMGCSVEMAETASENEKGWPESCNHLFYCAATRMRRTNTPFFWMEPDCVPLRKTWLDEIEAEYNSSGKPYMGFVYDKPWKHLTGCAVYPAIIARYNFQSLTPSRNANGVLPWDTVNAPATLKHTHESKLIYHQWDRDGAPPEFPTHPHVDLIPKEAAIYHRCKNGSLIDRLRERRENEAQKLRPVNLGAVIVGAAKKLVRSFKSVPKVDLLYICVRSPSEPNVPRNFRESHERFVSTYKKFKPTIPHRLIVVCYNGERDDETDELFGDLKPEYMHYRGTGFDIGTFLTIGRSLDSDFVLFCGSNVHFHQSGWLERMVEAFVNHGDGVYGPMASYEFSPHIRTCCLGTTPRLLRQYPHHVQTRIESYMFESGQWNYTRWVQGQGLPALMVMKDCELEQPDWRKPPNIFRRGDQSNCIIWDRHTLVYASATDADKRNYERMANGGRDGVSMPFVGERKRYKTITVVAVTSLNPEGHAKAIERTASLIPYKCEKLLICSQIANGFTGTQLPLPAPWAKDGKWSIHDMANFTLFGLHKYIKTDVAVMVHDDGYALNRSKWTDEFLDWDYIGAPWPKSFNWVKPDSRVGNGGFSLRSKRWFERASELYPLPQDFSEDVFSGVVHRDHFTHADCRIAPIDVAMKWSFEHVIEEFPKWRLEDSFGFHGIAKVTPLRKHLLLK